MNFKKKINNFLYGKHKTFQERLEECIHKERLKKYHNIYAAIIKMKNLDIVKGVDNKRIALISIEKRGMNFLVGLEEETKDSFGRFTKKYKECVKTIDDAIKFFDQNFRAVSPCL